MWWGSNSLQKRVAEMTIFSPWTARPSGPRVQVVFSSCQGDEVALASLVYLRRSSRRAAVESLVGSEVAVLTESLTTLPLWSISETTSVDSSFPAP